MPYFLRNSSGRAVQALFAESVNPDEYASRANSGQAISMLALVIYFSS